MDFILNPSLVLYLPLSERDGASFVSDDAYGHLATVTGALWTPQGRDFDGADDNISIPDHAMLSLGDGSADVPFTITMWVKFDSVTGVMNIVARDDLTTGAIKREFVFGQNDGHLNCYLYDSTVANIARKALNVLAIDTWYHLAATYNGLGASSGIKLYKNSVRVDDTTDDSGTYVAMEDMAQSLYVGCSLNSGGNPWRLLNGKIGELALYRSKEFTAVEVANNYLVTKWRYQ